MMQIAVSGSTGLVGSRLVSALKRDGNSVRRLVRSAPTSDDILWQPASGQVAAEQLEGLDAVVHLAGENIAQGRWTAAKKARIRESRVEGTRLLSVSLADRKLRPRAFISASAVGFYGDCGDRICDETTSAGTGFLAEVCQAWEEATLPAVTAGIRVVHLRIGVVLSSRGGALAAMLLPFKMGLGGKIGTGRQYMSWIAIDDLVRIVLFCLEREEVRGPVNAVAPSPVTNAEFTRALGRVLSRPTLFPMPAFAARLAFGEMADALLLASTRVVPARLDKLDFNFFWPEVEGALGEVIRQKV
jgi:uncharacterized protein (TIGR01777 family)